MRILYMLRANIRSFFIYLSVSNYRLGNVANLIFCRYTLDVTNL